MAPPFNRGGGRGSGRGRGRGRGQARYGIAPGGRHKTSTTNLPAALSEEMESSSSKFFAEGDDRDFSKKFKNKAAGRKVRRKQERLEKKKHRAPTLSKIEILARQQHMAPALKQGNNSDSNKNKSNKKQKLDPSHLEVNMDEHEGETLVTDIAKSDKKTKTKKQAMDSKKDTSSGDLDARRLEKLAKTNPAFYAMLQEDGVVAGGGLDDGFDEDEQYIRHYEKKLGLKRKDAGKLASKKSFLDDGLGDLLEGIELGSRGRLAAATSKKKASTAAPVASASKFGSKSETLSSTGKKRTAREVESEEDDEDSEDDDLIESEDEGDMDSFDEELEGVDPDDMDDSELEDEDEDDDNDEEMMMESDEEDMESFDEELEGVGSESDDDGDEDEEDMEDYDSDGEAEEDQESEDEAREAVSKAASAVQAGKYLPPHLRAAAAAAAAAATEGGASELAKAIPRQNTEELMRLRRQLQGLLNKLSESNIESILMDIEGLYRKYPRADVTETITDMILASISSKANLLDSFVILYATVVASLYRLIGIEFAAHFIQTLVEQFDTHHALASSTKSTEMTDETLSAVKQCTNLIVLVSELYNMQVIACVLVYELIRWFMTELSELNVELVVKIVKTSGYQLRQDDPTTLKTIIQDFTVLANQASTKKGSSTPISSRTRFLLETLTALKANRMKGASANSTTSGSIAESTTRMKKFLSGLSKKRTTFPSEPMRVGLVDIRQVKIKGKWWLVGSSWKNNMVGEDSTRKSLSTSTADDMLEAEDELLKLARKNKMNTDVRRSIFVVLMSSEDYIDAFERLIKLNLKEVQQREIVRVLLHCSGNEMVYNPYYTLVGQRLCQHDHSFKITFQYSLWDLLREMGATDVGGMEKVKDGQVIGLDDGVGGGGKKVALRKIVNLSKMYGFLITSQDLSLVMLKTVTFTSLPEQPTLFFQLLMTNIILSSQPQIHSPLQQQKEAQKDVGATKEKLKYNAQALADIFIRSAVNPTLAQGIIFFLQAFVKKGQVCQNDREKETVKWGCSTVREVLQGAVNTGGRF
ncbi:hypothetical protein EDD21DRAFT_316239 [Dissophora ornata]|nr:hypothetical protein EDD21DRAFT_316239 [Dissophora ornata]